MPKPGVFTVRVEPEKQKRLDELAESMDRSRNWLVNQALECYLDVQAWQIQQIRQGIEAADRGELATDEDINRVVNKYKPPSEA